MASIITILGQHYIDDERLQTLISLGLDAVWEEYQDSKAHDEIQPSGRFEQADMERTLEAGAALMRHLFPPSPDDGLPF